MSEGCAAVVEKLLPQYIMCTADKPLFSKFEVCLSLLRPECSAPVNYLYWPCMLVPSFSKEFLH